MEQRVDPEDGVPRTLEEVKKKYSGIYSLSEIEAYFQDDCRPLQSGGYKSSAPVQSDAGLEGLEGWLEERGLEDYLEIVTKWCEENGAITLDEVDENFEDIKAMILASEIDPGDRVRITVLKGKWTGTYVATVLGTDSKGIRIRHEEDDYEESLPWSSLGGKKYTMEPVTDDEDEDEEAVEVPLNQFLRLGHLRVDPDAGAGLELRWVKVGYCVDRVDRKPGQPDLREGDAMVAFGGAILAGLDEDGVEERFGAKFADGVSFVAAPLKELMRPTIEEVCREAEKFLAANQS